MLEEKTQNRSSFLANSLPPILYILSICIFFVLSKVHVTLPVIFVRKKESAPISFFVLIVIMTVAKKDTSFHNSQQTYPSCYKFGLQAIYGLKSTHLLYKHFIFLLLIWNSKHFMEFRSQKKFCKTWQHDLSLWQ